MQLGLERSWATNSDFLIPLSFEPYVVNLWYFKLVIFDYNSSHSLKCQLSTTLVCKDIGIRKSEFVTKTQFLYDIFCYRRMRWKEEVNFPSRRYFIVSKWLITVNHKLQNCFKPIKIYGLRLSWLKASNNWSNISIQFWSYSILLIHIAYRKLSIVFYSLVSIIS